MVASTMRAIKSPMPSRGAKAELEKEGCHGQCLAGIARVSQIGFVLDHY